MSLRAIQFTQEQARIATEIPFETLRHWRKLIPYLARKSGKTARFTFADLVGLAVTREIVESFGVRIGTVQVGIDMLFRILANSRINVIQAGLVVMTTDTAKLYSHNQAIKLELPVTAIVVPCRSHVLRLQERVLPGLRSDQQPGLPFLPRAVRK